jgi:hypothetical protein
MPETGFLFPFRALIGFITLRRWILRRRAAMETQLRRVACSMLPKTLAFSARREIEA